MILKPLLNYLLMYGGSGSKIGKYCIFFDTVPLNEISVDHHLVNQSQMWSANGNKGELCGVEMDRHAQYIRADRYNLQYYTSIIIHSIKF